MTALHLQALLSSTPHRYLSTCTLYIYIFTLFYTLPYEHLQKNTAFINTENLTLADRSIYVYPLDGFVILYRRELSVILIVHGLLFTLNSVQLYITRINIFVIKLGKLISSNGFFSNFISKKLSFKTTDFMPFKLLRKV